MLGSANQKYRKCLKTRVAVDICCHSPTSIFMKCSVFRYDDYLPSASKGTFCTIDYISSEKRGSVRRNPFRKCNFITWGGVLTLSSGPSSSGIITARQPIRVRVSNVLFTFRIWRQRWLVDRSQRLLPWRSQHGMAAICQIPRFEIVEMRPHSSQVMKYRRWDWKLEASMSKTHRFEHAIHLKSIENGRIWSDENVVAPRGCDHIQTRNLPTYSGLIWSKVVSKCGYIPYIGDASTFLTMYPHFVWFWTTFLGSRKPYFTKYRNHNCTVHGV